MPVRHNALKRTYTLTLEQGDFAVLEQLAQRSHRTTASYLRCLIKAHLYTMRLLEPERFTAHVSFADNGK